MNEADHKSYEFQELSRKKIKKLATQYKGHDMAKLMGADENNFPFLVEDSDDSFQVMFWNRKNGIMMNLDEDEVRQYATVKYLKENAYPRFRTTNEARQWAKEHHWPKD